MAFGNFDPEGATNPMAEINTTPLVDVMLVLLVIFLLTAPLLTHSIPVDLPQAAGHPLPDPPKPVEVSVTADGRIFLDDLPVAATALPARFAALAQRTPVPEVHLRADKASRYEVIALIMGAAREAGLERLAFVMEQKGARAAGTGGVAPASNAAPAPVAPSASAPAAAPAAAGIAPAGPVPAGR
jgi:biopolymer transport protein ExbD